MRDHHTCTAGGGHRIETGSWVDRSGVERRSGRDKRQESSSTYFRGGGRERRLNPERRTPEERRDGWLRAGMWNSVLVFDHAGK